MMKTALIILIFYYVHALPDPRAILNNINIARTTPTAFATIIQTKYSTIDGASQAISFLTTSPVLSPLTLSTALSAGAQLHANYLKTQSFIINPHFGCQNNLASDRVSQVGNFTKVAENIMSGVSNEEEIVARWIIDSANTNKINRRNVLYNDFKHVGFGSSTTPYIDNLVVAYFADGFSCELCPNVPEPDIEYSCTANPFTYGSLSSPKIFLSIFLMFTVIIFIFF